MAAMQHITVDRDDCHKYSFLLGHMGLSIVIFVTRGLGS